MGQFPNPGGRPKEKPFADALRMEIKAAGDNHKKLRAIARKLLAKAEEGDMQAINCVADRLDGKPTQDMEVTRRVSLADVSDDELAAILREPDAEEASGNGSNQAPIDPSQLN